ncbi:MAG: hypothetical protein RQ741_08950 [Wenzhouxiangellaceae bacterium]|nr:hypothetical protein [Wenzhouxiangellaceae bacterium]
MKILSLLVALLVSHHGSDLARLRQYGWLLAGPQRISQRGPDWLPAMTLLAISLVVGMLATWLAAELAGLFGLLLLGIVTVLYTLGPRDLDRDIQMASGDEQSKARQVALEHLLLNSASGGSQAAAAALQAALARWFGIILWFVVLGVPGCLLYRGVREAFHSSGLAGRERAWMAQLLRILNWPVMLLLTLALALMTDFDRVRAAFQAREDRWQFPAALLDDLAGALCDPDESLEQGLADGRQLAWRVLGLWLAVLGLLLLAGLLS